MLALGYNEYGLCRSNYVESVLSFSLVTQGGDWGSRVSNSLHKLACSDADFQRTDNTHYGSEIRRKA